MKIKMIEEKSKRVVRYRQRIINCAFVRTLMTNICILMMILFIAFTATSVKAVEASKNKIENDIMANTSENTIGDNVIIPSVTILPTVAPVPTPSPSPTPINIEINSESKINYDRNWSDEERYLLAKIAMAEAEGESIETKVLVILVVLNRVCSEKSYFPDTIKEVIFQNSNGVYQFAPISNGRWDRVEPNTECWEAVEIVSQLEYDVSNGALYFEACSGESWHSRNLEFICQSDHTRFYK